LTLRAGITPIPILKAAEMGGRFLSAGAAECVHLGCNLSLLHACLPSLAGWGPARSERSIHASLGAYFSHAAPPPHNALHALGIYTSPLLTGWRRPTQCFEPNHHEDLSQTGYLMYHV
jgi:hypothetical protein